VSTSTPTVSAGAPSAEHAGLRRLSWLFLVLGSVSMLIGFLAIGAPHVATTKTVIVIGVLLVIAGLIEAFHAVMMRNLRGFAIHLLAAALYLMIGFFVLEDPDRAAGVITLLLAASFFAGGVLRIGYALAERFPAWPWVLLNGAVDLLLGVLIWRGWPESKEWVIGLFVGIELILHGWSWVALALTVRSVGPAKQV
jgi:uncharacterized membrane protein HdeD (DUF308 family)